MGVGVLLIGLRGHVPAWATFPLANFLLFAYLMMRIQSLRLDLSAPWRREWMMAAALLFVLVLEYIRLGLENLTLVVIYNNSVYTVISYYLATLAWRLGHQEKSHSAFWIAWSYRTMAAGTLLSAISCSMGLGVAPSPDMLDANPFRLVMVIVIIPFMVISHIAYVGFILERTHRQIIEAEKQYRAIIETTLDGFCVCDMEGRFIDVNKTYCDMIGYGRDELLTMRLSDIKSDGNTLSIQARIQQTMQMGFNRFESRHQCKNGRLLEVEISTTFQPTGAGQFLVFMHDITRRKRSELALRKSEEKFKALADDSPLAIYMTVGVEQKNEYINLTALTLFGYTLDETPTVEQWWPLAYPDEAYRRQVEEEWQRKVEKAIETRSEIEPMEVVVTCKDGSRKNIQWGFKAIGEQNWAFGIDLTARRQMENELRDSEARLRSYFELPLTGRAITSPSTGWIEVNTTLCDMLGYNETELTQMTWAELTHPDDLTTDLAQFNRVMAGEIDGYTMEKRFIHKNGHSVHTHLAVHCLRKPDQSVDYFVALIIDISDLRKAEESLKHSEERLRQITDIAPVFLAEIDKELCYRFVNRRYAELFGLPPDQFCGKRVSTIIPEQALANSQPYMLKALNDQSVEFETELTEPSGKRKFLAARYAPRHDDTGQVIGFVAAIIDITERKRAEEEIKQLAFYDPLTQLPNRRLLLDRLQQATVNSDRDKTHGALLFIDLDNFKTLNDTLGHDKGDLLLQQVASRVTAGVRESDTVARFGGDEFVVMLTGLAGDIEEAAAQTQKIGWKIIDNLNQTYSLAGYEHYCSASIGITLFFGHDSSIDDLLKMADVAMYQAKAQGRNTLRIFDPRMQPPIASRATLTNDLHRALEKNQFELFYQIEVGHNQKAVGAEALLRWNHPERGLILPQEFIPLAEETGLIQPIGQWVLKSACTLIKSWDKRPNWQHLHLAVNISVRQFQQPNFVDNVCEILRETGANPGRLMLEVAENVVLVDLNQAIAIISALKDCGVRFSLGHSGTGHSSLAHLVRLPFDQMKIDRSFVQNIAVNPSDSAIIENLMVMAEKLGVAIVAEGVETEAQRASLEKFGCPVYQGYLFGKPLPLAEFEGQFEL